MHDIYIYKYHLIKSAVNNIPAFESRKQIFLVCGYKIKSLQRKFCMANYSAFLIC